MRISLPVLVALTIGFATGAIARDSVVAPARAVPPGVQKWTQFCTPYGSTRFLSAADIAGAINPDLQKRGLEGWELVSAVPVPSSGYTGSVLYCFRQPMQ